MLIKADHIDRLGIDLERKINSDNKFVLSVWLESHGKEETKRVMSGVNLDEFLNNPTHSILLAVHEAGSQFHEPELLHRMDSEVKTLISFARTQIGDHHYIKVYANPSHLNKFVLSGPSASIGAPG